MIRYSCSYVVATVSVLRYLCIIFITIKKMFTVCDERATEQTQLSTEIAAYKSVLMDRFIERTLGPNFRT